MGCIPYIVKGRLGEFNQNDFEFGFDFVVLINKNRVLVFKITLVAYNI